jgi:hypothetical protein
MEVVRIRLHEGRRRERGRMRRAMIRFLEGGRGSVLAGRGGGRGVQEGGRGRGSGVEDEVGLKCRGLKTERDLQQRQA